MIASKTPEPLPGDPNGKRLCEIFGTYLWQAIHAATPEDGTQKPKWQTITKYPLRPRILWSLWQDANTLIGVRFGQTTRYALIDLDAGGAYCSTDAMAPKGQSLTIAQLRAALETIGITRTLLVRSSWSGGLHLYIPLPEAVSTFNLAVALKACLKAQGFELKSGQLEIFPNVKAFGVTAFIEYNAHRLPLQPGSGSCLLDDALQPVTDNLARFLWVWEGAAQAQDIDLLRQALTSGRNAHRKRPKRQNLSTIESWRTDLETEISEGWTDYGQTNHLLKSIACYGHVFEGLKGQALEEYTLRIATSRPGYETYCRHQSEIRHRAIAWARAAENYYWPLGSDPKRSAHLHQNNIVPFNQRRSEDAQARIKGAYAHLEELGILPEQITARATAIHQQASVSLETLYKHRHLWHPHHQTKESVIDQSTSHSADPEPPRPQPRKSPEPVPDKELRTSKETMKGVVPEGPGVGLETPVSSPNRGVRGDEPVSPQMLELPDAQVDNKIRHYLRLLGWSYQEVCRFIADRFSGKRRSELNSDELLTLLYYLQTRG
ncbi:MAG TPA: hypothetical protein V6D29_13085 [Leptolyngbyaceae cyanobacterium]